MPRHSQGENLEEKRDKGTTQAGKSILCEVTT